MDRGNRLVAAGKYADAELEYRQSIQKDPKFAEGYYRLGLLEYKLGRGGEALQDFQRAVDFSPSNDRYAIELASVGIEAFQVIPTRRVLYDQAAQEAEVLLKKDPNSFDGHRLRGDVLVIDRKYDEAFVELQKANAIRPNDANVILAMTQILFTQNQNKEGEALLLRFLSVRKDSREAYDLLETHYGRDRRWAEAENLLQSEIAALPKDARPRLQLAALYHATGREQQMLQQVSKVASDRQSFPDGLGQVGDFYADLGKWDEALVQYHAGIQGASDKASYHKRMVRAYQALGKRQEAIGELSEVLKSSPADLDSRLARAILLREDPAPKQRDLAMQEFQTLATQYPQNAMVHYNLALLYLNKGDTTAASREAKKSADLQRDYVDPRLLQIEMAQTAQNYQLAVDKSAEVLAIDPKNLAARLMRASALVGGKAYREAEVEINDLSKLQPNNKDVDLVMASLDMAEKQYSKAHALYERHYQKGSSDLRPLEGLIQCYVVDRQPEKAETLLSEELKQQPESQPIRMLLASVATQERKFDVAAAQYRWLQAKDPASAKSYAALGDLYQAQGATQDALASYEKASKLAPSDPKILNAIAVLESNTGQAKQAIATLDKQLALDPNNAAAMNNLAFNLAETGQDLDRALTLAERVARKFPNDPGVIDTLGWVYVKRGLNQSAIQVLRGLVKKYPKEAAYRYHLAIALIQDKQTVDGKRELQAALLNHPAKDLSSKIQENLTQVR